MMTLCHKKQSSTTRFLCLLLLLLSISSSFFTLAIQNNQNNNTLINIFTEEEVKQCYGKISKDPQFVSGNGWVHIVTACREGTEGINDDNQNMHIQQQERRRRLDPINKNVCIMKSSKDGGYTWVNFQVISFNGWKGTYFNGCKGIYDRYRDNLLVQYAHSPPGGDELNKTIYQIISKDDGKTWTNPRNIDKYLSSCKTADKKMKGRLGANNAGNRIQLDNGRLIWGTSGTLHGAICLWYSDDGGETYNATGVFAEHTNEWSMVIADNTTGLLLINSRATPGTDKEKFRKNQWSKDNGVTWSKAEESTLEDSVNKHGHGCEASLTNIDNKLFFLNPTGQGDDARTKMVVRCSLDHGKTWPKSYHVTSTTSGGYSDLIRVNVNNDKILMIGWGYHPDGNVHDPNSHTNIQIEHIAIDWC